MSKVTNRIAIARKAMEEAAKVALEVAPIPSVSERLQQIDDIQRMNLNMLVSSYTPPTQSEAIIEKLAEKGWTLMLDTSIPPNSKDYKGDMEKFKKDMLFYKQCDASKFRGQIYQDEGGNLNVCFRGTASDSVGTFVKNWQTNATIGMYDDINNPMHECLTQFTQIIYKYSKVDTTIKYSGHSMGGALATNAAAMSSVARKAGQKIECVTSDGVGVPAAIDKIIEAQKIIHAMREHEIVQKAKKERQVLSSEEIADYVNKPIPIDTLQRELKIIYAHDHLAHLAYKGEQTFKAGSPGSERVFQELLRRDALLDGGVNVAKIQEQHLHKALLDLYEQRNGAHYAAQRSQDRQAFINKDQNGIMVINVAFAEIRKDLNGKKYWQFTEVPAAKENWGKVVAFGVESGVRCPPNEPDPNRSYMQAAFETVLGIPKAVVVELLSPITENSTVLGAQIHGKDILKHGLEEGGGATVLYVKDKVMLQQSPLSQLLLTPFSETNYIYETDLLKGCGRPSELRRNMSDLALDGVCVKLGAGIGKERSDSVLSEYATFSGGSANKAPVVKNKSHEV